MMFQTPESMVDRLNTLYEELVKEGKINKIHKNLVGKIESEYSIYFDDINYWLEQWLLFYQNIINNFQSFKNCNLICYEKLCYNNDYFNKIKSILKLNENLDFKFKNSLQNITLNVDNNLLLECNKLYDTMKTK